MRDAVRKWLDSLAEVPSHVSKSPGLGHDATPEPKPVPKKCPDPLKLARYYQSLLDSGKFESRAALARYLGVSRARVTQVHKQLFEL
jgi:hypothetical protein